jgi:hypothetical protein
VLQEGPAIQNVLFLKLSEFYCGQRCLISVTEFIENIVAVLA